MNMSSGYAHKNTVTKSRASNNNITMFTEGIQHTLQTQAVHDAVDISQLALM